LAKSIQRNPDPPQTYRDVGRTLIQTQDDTRVIDFLKKVTQLDPAEPSGHCLLTLSFAKTRNDAFAV